MAYAIPPPKEMTFAGSGNLENAWTTFKEAWGDYRIAVGLDKKNANI